MRIDYRGTPKKGPRRHGWEAAHGGRVGYPPAESRRLQVNLTGCQGDRDAAKHSIPAGCSGGRRFKVGSDPPKLRYFELKITVFWFNLNYA